MLIRIPLLLVLLASPAFAQTLATEAPPSTTAEPPPNAEEEAPSSSKKKKKKDRSPEVAGVIQTFFRYAFETGDDGLVDKPNFRVQRARLKIRGKLFKRVRYVLEIDPRAPEITGLMRDAYVEIKLFRAHRLRIGQQKTHFGYENLTSSTRLYAVNRSEIADALMRGGVTLRDVGVGLIGHYDLSDTFRIEDGITVTNGNGSNTQDDSSRAKNVWGRVGLRYKSDAFKIWWGASAGRGDFIDEGELPLDPSDDFRLDFKRLGTDLRFDNDYLFASAEFAWGRDAYLDETEDLTGYYLNLVGKTPWKVGPIARLDSFAEEKRRWTLGAYYDPHKRMRLMINYEYRPIMEEVRGDDKLYFWMQAKF